MLWVCKKLLKHVMQMQTVQGISRTEVNLEKVFLERYKKFLLQEQSQGTQFC